MRAEAFSFCLLRAVTATGSVLDVARRLEVEPRQVHRWIAELERPRGAQLRELESRLSALLAAPLGS